MRYLFTFILLLIAAQTSNAQILGNYYSQQDTMNITTTPRDEFYSVRWEWCTVYADSGDFYAIWAATSTGAVDTTSFTSKPAVLIRAGDQLFFDSTMKLRRLRVWSRFGTDIIYIIGAKKQAQF